MQRLTAALIALAFVLWILPLGVFIAPSKEKFFCGGQRAICMCSHHLGKHKPAAPPAGESLSKADDQNEEGSGPSSSNHYDNAAPQCILDTHSFLYHFGHETLYSLLIPRPVEHVPKA